MKKNVKFIVVGLVGVAVVVAAYFGAAGGLQGKMEISRKLPAVKVNQSKYLPDIASMVYPVTLSISSTYDSSPKIKWKINDPKKVKAFYLVRSESGDLKQGRLKEGKSLSGDYSENFFEEDDYSDLVLGKIYYYQIEVYDPDTMVIVSTSNIVSTKSLAFSSPKINLSAKIMPDDDKGEHTIRFVWDDNIYPSKIDGYYVCRSLTLPMSLPTYSGDFCPGGSGNALSPNLLGYNDQWTFKGNLKPDKKFADYHPWPINDGYYSDSNKKVYYALVAMDHDGNPITISNSVAVLGMKKVIN